MPEVTQVIHCWQPMMTDEGETGHMNATIAYNSDDPYAVKFSFGEDTDWIVARDLLAAGLVGPAGSGDFQIVPERSDLYVTISISVPSGSIAFRTGMRAISAFLERSYELVAAGDEGSTIDVEAEIWELGL